MIHDKSIKETLDEYQLMIDENEEAIKLLNDQVSQMIERNVNLIKLLNELKDIATQLELVGVDISKTSVSDLENKSPIENDCKVDLDTLMKVREGKMFKN